MGDEEGGDADLALDAADLVPELAANPGVEGRERFVEEQDGRPDGERPRQRHPLLLATRELVRVAIRLGAQPDQLEHLPGPLAAFGDPDLAHAQPEGDVLPGRHVGKERVRLEHHAGVAPAGR